MTLDATTAVTSEQQDIARTVQAYTQQLNASNTRAIVDLHTSDANSVSRHTQAKRTM